MEEVIEDPPAILDSLLSQVNSLAQVDFGTYIEHLENLEREILEEYFRVPPTNPHLREFANVLLQRPMEIGDFELINIVNRIENKTVAGLSEADQARAFAHFSSVVENLWSLPVRDFMTQYQGPASSWDDLDPFDLFGPEELDPFTGEFPAWSPASTDVVPDLGILGVARPVGEQGPVQELDTAAPQADTAEGFAFEDPFADLDWLGLPQADSADPFADLDAPVDLDLFGDLDLLAASRFNSLLDRFLATRVAGESFPSLTRLTCNPSTLRETGKAVVSAVEEKFATFLRTVTRMASSGVSGRLPTIKNNLRTLDDLHEYAHFIELGAHEVLPVQKQQERLARRLTMLRSRRRQLEKELLQDVFSDDRSDSDEEVSSPQRKRRRKHFGKRKRGAGDKTGKKIHHFRRIEWERKLSQVQERLGLAENESQLFKTAINAPLRALLQENPPLKQTLTDLDAQRRTNASLIDQEATLNRFWTQITPHWKLLAAAYAASREKPEHLADVLAAAQLQVEKIPPASTADVLAFLRQAILEDTSLKSVAHSLSGDLQTALDLLNDASAPCDSLTLPATFTNLQHFASQKVFEWPAIVGALQQSLSRVLQNEFAAQAILHTEDNLANSENLVDAATVAWTNFAAVEKDLKAFAEGQADVPVEFIRELAQQCIAFVDAYTAVQMAALTGEALRQWAYFVGLVDQFVNHKAPEFMPLRLFQSLIFIYRTLSPEKQAQQLLRLRDRLSKHVQTKQALATVPRLDSIVNQLLELLELSDKFTCDAFDAFVRRHQFLSPELLVNLTTALQTLDTIPPAQLTFTNLDLRAQIILKAAELLRSNEGRLWAIWYEEKSRVRNLEQLTSDRDVRDRVLRNIDDRKDFFRSEATTPTKLLAGDNENDYKARMKQMADAVDNLRSTIPELTELLREAAGTDLFLRSLVELSLRRDFFGREASKKLPDTEQAEKSQRVYTDLGTKNLRVSTRNAVVQMIRLLYPDSAELQQFRLITEESRGFQDLDDAFTKIATRIHETFGSPLLDCSRDQELRELDVLKNSLAQLDNSDPRVINLLERIFDTVGQINLFCSDAPGAVPAGRYNHADFGYGNKLAPPAVGSTSGLTGYGYYTPQNGLSYSIESILTAMDHVIQTIDLPDDIQWCKDGQLYDGAGTLPLDQQRRIDVVILYVLGAGLEVSKVGADYKPAYRMYNFNKPVIPDRTITTRTGGYTRGTNIIWLTTNKKRRAYFEGTEAIEDEDQKYLTDRQRKPQSNADAPESYGIYQTAVAPLDFDLTSKAGENRCGERQYTEDRKKYRLINPCIKIRACAESDAMGLCRLALRLSTEERKRLGFSDQTIDMCLSIMNQQSRRDLASDYGVGFLEYGPTDSAAADWRRKQVRPRDATDLAEYNRLLPWIYLASMPIVSPKTPKKRPNQKQKLKSWVERQSIVHATEALREIRNRVEEGTLTDFEQALLIKTGLDQLPVMRAARYIRMAVAKYEAALGVLRNDNQQTQALYKAAAAEKSASFPWNTQPQLALPLQVSLLEGMDFIVNVVISYLETKSITVDTVTLTQVFVNLLPYLNLNDQAQQVLKNWWHQAVHAMRSSTQISNLETLIAMITQVLSVYTAARELPLVPKNTPPSVIQDALKLVPNIDKFLARNERSRFAKLERKFAKFVPGKVGSATPKIISTFARPLTLKQIVQLQSAAWMLMINKNYENQRVGGKRRQHIQVSLPITDGMGLWQSNFSPAVRSAILLYCRRILGYYADCGWLALSQFHPATQNSVYASELGCQLVMDPRMQETDDWMFTSQTKDKRKTLDNLFDWFDAVSQPALYPQDRKPVWHDN